MGGRKTDPIERLVGQYSTWLGGAPDDEALGNLDLMLTVRRDYLGGDLDTWREGEISELLLDVFPRKVQSDPSLLRDGPGILVSFLRYLEKTRQLRGSGLYQLEAELAEVRPRFAAAMQDASRFGMAKSLFASMSADGVEVEDPDAIQEWIEDFNARPYAERAALTDDVVPTLPGPELVLPPVTLASEEELRRAAEAAPLVQRVSALLAYVGPQGRAVTQTGALRLLDAKALAETCGDEERLPRPEHLRREVRRMADLPGVHETYELAVLADLLHVGATRVRRDPSSPAATDPAAMAAGLATAAVEVGVFVGEVPDHIADVVGAVDEQLPGMLSALYAAGEPVGAEELAGHLADEIGLAPDSTWRGGVRSYLERAFARFERLGMLTRLGLHVPPDLERIGLSDPRATSVSLTPLGVWWLRELLAEGGVRAPLLGELAVASAAGLADGLQGYSLEDGQAELAAWSVVRGSEEAARQIAALLGDPDVGRRQFALAVLADLPAAEGAARSLLDDPAARPYARMWLETAGHEVAEAYRHAADDALLFVETAGLILGHAGPDELVAQLPGEGQDLQVDLVRQLWRVDSPFTEPVLQALATSAPRVLSKAARKALFSFRSAQKG
ncbi:MAG: hypothetical protein M3486_03410 [Actinomycetota bacterium]|nr:hypothetical protein [Actinomycetota bacterium]